MPDLLVELGCEELPAVACREAEAQLASLAPEGVANVLRQAAEARWYVAPRRIAVVVGGLAPSVAGVAAERRGPRTDAPAQAREGFARSMGAEEHELREEGGFLWFRREQPDVATAELVPAFVRHVAEGIRFSRTMRWDGGAFARPVRWLVVLLGAEVVQMSFAGVASGATTRGRRFAGAGPVATTPGRYLEDLRAAGVVADAAERRAAITEGLGRAGSWEDPGGVAEEVVYLVEWPQVWTGSFDRRYLDLPERVVVTAMQSHQRYFPLRGDGGALEPRFAFVANGGREAVVVAGNEEVLVGRLEDAEFAHRHDLERGIEAMAGELGRVSFLEGAGSLAQKSERLAALVRLLAEANPEVAAADADAAADAARLAKADLVSGLVAEFSDLQGYAGSVYARAAGQPEAVCRAIEEHYRPVEAGGALPETAAGALLATADKLDTVAAAIAVGAQPTGSRDPLGLRRAAAGAVAVTLERGLVLRPEELVDASVRALVAAGGDVRRGPVEVVPAALAFLLDRVEAVLLDERVTVEEVRAARGSALVEPVAVAGLARALRDARGADWLAALRDAQGRCARISARGGELSAWELRRDLLVEPAEQALYAELERVEVEVADRVAVGRFDDALEAAAGIVPAVTRLFEDVLVMAEDEALRANRLRLVASVADTLRLVGELEQLPG